jgi:cysteine desulfurase
MVAALVEAEQKKVFMETERLRWRRVFEREILAAVPGASVVAAGADRLWNTVLLLMPYSDNTRWVARLDRRGFQISTGSACATGKAGPSPVLITMGYSPTEAVRVVRVSAGWETTEVDWQALAAALGEAAAELRGGTPGLITV